jgi:small subunit ribosomal protein S6
MPEVSSTIQIPQYQREYETLYVLKPEFEDPQVIEVIEKMRGIVAKEGGKTLKITNWGRKKLAYEVDGNQKGIYVHHRYVGLPKVSAELDRNLRIMDQVIRHQTVVIAKQILADQKQVEEDLLVPPVKEGRKEREREDDEVGEGFGRHHEEDDVPGIEV